MSANFGRSPTSARQPAPVGRARHTHCRDARGGVAGDQAQPPAQGLQLECQPFRVLAVVDQARGDLDPDSPEAEEAAQMRAESWF